MEFRVLGPVGVHDGEGALELGARQQALLARLLLDVGRPVAAARLIEDLWGEAQPPTANKMVQVYVSQLRKVLPEPVLKTRGQGYALEVEPDALDLHRFEALRAEGRVALEQGDAAKAATRLREALALWRGPALADLVEPFAASETARLEEERLATLEDRIDADLLLARHADLVAELRQLVKSHPLRERLSGQLMLALYRSGRQAEALEAYHEQRRTLDDALGIAPSRALQDLHTRILRQDPELDVQPGAPGAAIDGAPDVRYATAPDGTKLAYAIHGTPESQTPLVRVATWLTNLELDWQSPVWRHWLEGLGMHRTVLRYDERGCGMSDRELGTPDLDQWVGDLATVIDASGLAGPVDLLGVSQGGAIAVAYAVRHPERVRKIVLYGTYLRGRQHRGDPDQAKESRALTALMRSGWGVPDSAYRRVFTNLFLPDGTDEQMRWYDDLQKRTSSGEVAARLREARDGVDVTELATQVTQPTLVLHARGDRVIPVEEGRLAAEVIPGAEYEELPSRNHILLSDEIAWAMLLGTVDRFLITGEGSG